MEIIENNTVKFLTSAKLSGVRHGFSLRTGGVSKGCFESLNVGLRRGDNPFCAFKNIEVCADALSLEKERLTLTYQTHSSNVVFLKHDDIGKGLIKEWGMGVDGIVTDMKNVPLMCYSADCVPSLLYDNVRGMIGAVHGGWRGVRDNIIKNAVEVMREHGAIASDIRAFIGPAIGMCCYEVSEDVAVCFLKDFPESVKDKGMGKYMLDLKAITKAQLLKSGVVEENIDVSRFCTSCNNDLFFSHRRQSGKSGLLGGFIQMI